MFEILKRILSLVDRSTLAQACGVGALVLLGTALETLGIGLIFPFMKLVIDPAAVHGMAWITNLYGPVDDGGERDVLIVLALSLLAVFVIKNLLLIAVYYAQARFVATNEALLARRLLGVYLTGPYALHLTRNSAELIRNVYTTVTSVFSAVFMGFVTLSTEICLIVALAGLLVFAEPLLTLSAVIVLSLAVSVFYRLVRRRFAVWGAAQLRVSKDILQSLQEGFHSIKEVKVLGIARHVIDRFYHARRALSVIQTNHTTLTNIPRLWIETVTVVGIISVIVAVLWRGGETASVVATLSLFAAAVFRLVPSMNRILIALTSIKNGQEAVFTVCRDIAEFSSGAEDEGAGRPFPPLLHEIRLEDIDFQYGNADRPALSGIDLVIRKGESVGLAGPSGAGKTTLVDVLLGLLQPTSGRVLVDGADIAGAGWSWRRQVGYVPQSIYIADGTIRRNVAFGISDTDIDDVLVWRALEQAQLDDFVRGLRNGLDTIVGEHGARLSGGQRQRIGIARALYRDPAVLILDEATAALDSETEHEFNRAIELLGGRKTLIIIAHRLSTIRKCDRVVFLDQGRVVDSGSFQQLSAGNATFRRMVELSAL